MPTIPSHFCVFYCPHYKGYCDCVNCVCGLLRKQYNQRGTGYIYSICHWLYLWITQVLSVEVIPAVSGQATVNKKELLPTLAHKG